MSTTTRHSRSSWLADETTPIGTPMTATLRKKLYRVTEAAEILSLGRTQIFKEMAAGRLQAVGAGKTRRIPAEAIDAYVELLKQEAEDN